MIPLTKPNRALPLDPRRFCAAVHHTLRVLADPTPAPAPIPHGLLRTTDDPFGGITLPDTALLRVVQGFLAFFPDLDAHLSAVWRWQALMQVVADPTASTWVHHDAEAEGMVGIHTALIYAAAQSKLTKSGRFRRSRIMEEAAQIAATLDE